MKLSDKQINDLLKNKPQKAIKYLFDLYYDDLCRYAYSLVETKEIAEELVQELFIYLWEKRASVNINSSAKSYLFKAVKNQSINYFKSKYSRSKPLYLEEESLVGNFTHEKGEIEELSEITKKAINSLPERCALIFKLSRNFGMTYKEIADCLGISIKTVEAQMTIAFKRIRIYLDNHWFNKK